MMAFVPLHTYSGYSFLQSGLTVPRYVGIAKKRGLRYLSLTDKNTMSGLPEFVHLCSSNGIVPICGMDIEVDGDLLTLIIADEKGYRNAMELDLLSSERKLGIEDLKGRSEGLCAILDCGKGRFRYLYESEQTAEIPSFLSKWDNLFPSFFLGLPYYPGAEKLNNFIRSFVAKYPYDKVAFPHLLYEKPQDAIVLEIVRAIASESKLTQKEATGPNYFLSDEEASNFYAADELFATERICSSIHFEFIAKRGGLLVYPNERGLTSEQYLRELAYAGLGKKNPGYGREYQERLDYELSVISKMGYADYFLIVQDYVNYARRVGISVGPGRGSGAGSLVSYALGIVTPDPIKYGLLFERFLNPERQSMPDIDVDFADIRRDEIAIYLQKKYGRERVSHIITMQTLGARASLRDIGRVYDYENREIDLIAKTITDPKLSLRDNYRRNADFKKLIDSDKYYLQIVSLAAKIEGLPRQPGLHAAGVVLNDAPLSTAVPITDSESVGYIAQYEMNYLEEQGFLKMDLLGLRNLTIVDNCISLIEESHGIHLDYASIPYEEKEPIALIASGKTMGIFQLESPGMNKAIREVKPTDFNDLVAILALFRPGPMQNIPSYGRRKRGEEKITYITPELQPILASTYGIIVYQEQIMQIVRRLAGFTFGQADSFRRAISKKDALKLQSLKADFILGCIQSGTRKDIAEAVYALIYKFADYGFNKSHSLCYAILSCQMAWLKYHYPIEFYCAILDSLGPSDPKFAPLISEIKKSGISFALPSINVAVDHFFPKDGKIVFPFTSIKGIQSSLAYGIIEERRKKPYEDIFDVARRLAQYGLNAQNLVKLIDAGCLDEFGYNRPSLRLASSAAFSYAELFGGGGSSDASLLLDLGIPKPNIATLHDDPISDLNAERLALGIMVSGSPLLKKRSEIAMRELAKLSDLLETKSELTVAAVIQSVKAITTKKGSRMAFVLFYDEEIELEATMFEEAYNNCFAALREGALVAARIRPDMRREGGYIVESVETL